jgi:multidrug efflux pump subunit AcrB
VFVPLVFMQGVGKYLFTPLAVSAALAMFASYFVSRTVSPLYCSRALRPHTEHESLPWKAFLWIALVAAVGLTFWLLEPLLLQGLLRLRLPWGGTVLRGAVHLLSAAGIGAGIFTALAPVMVGLFWLAGPFNRVYEGVAGLYERALRLCLRRRVIVPALVLAALAPAIWCFSRLGQELFPEVDSGEFTVHVRLSGGPRVEETERQVAEIEDLVREVVPEEDLELILANVGISSRWSAIYTENNGPHAAFLRVQLRSGFAGRRTPAGVYVERLRERLAQRYPGDDFFFESGGMIRRILNQGSVAPIEVQVFGRDQEVRRAVTRQLNAQIARLPQVLDTYMPQGMDLPQLRVEVDRTRAAQLGFSQTDVIRNVITALMSSAQIAPNFWLDPESGNPYYIGVQYPERLVENIWTLENVPISSERTGRALGRSGADRPTVRLLRDVARLERVQGPVEAYHYDVNPVSQLLVSVAGNDLAGVASQVERLVDRPPLEYALDNLPENREHLPDDEQFLQRLGKYLKKGTPAQREAMRKDYGVDPERLKLPPGVRVQVRGEVSAMRHSFSEMAFSLMLAVLLVYLLMVALFQSFRDPLIVIVAAPLGLIGVAWLLWATDTSLNIQSLMGVLMMVGISVSNSVLLVEFANGLLAAGHDPVAAVVDACRIRLRPILMTTLATIAGLLPMALHLRPGDEMNVPLARAVIGGLTGSTLLTLFAVPVLYVLLKRGTATRPAGGVS